MHRDRALLLQASTVKPLLILMALWGARPCYCVGRLCVQTTSLCCSPILLGMAVKLLSWDLEVEEDLLDLHVCGNLTVTYSITLAGCAVFMSPWPWRDMAWYVGADADLIYEKTQAWNRRSPKRSDDLMLTNVMKSSFGVHVSTCHAL